MSRYQKHSSDEERQIAIKISKTKYMLNKPWYCNICVNEKDYKLAGKWSHLKTKKHQRNHEKIILNSNKYI